MDQSIGNNNITPPPELVQQWRKSGPADAAVNNAYECHIATCAAQWGADTELEACLTDVSFLGSKSLADKIRAARRPKPPSLKEQALAELAEWERIMDIASDSPMRRALEAFPDD
jgi:hypothetical protein